MFLVLQLHSQVRASLIDKAFEGNQINTCSIYSYSMQTDVFLTSNLFKKLQIRICTTLVLGLADLTFQILEVISRTTMFKIKKFYMILTLRLGVLLDFLLVQH